MSLEDKLGAPFVAKDIEWRIQQCGWKEKNGAQVPWAMVLAYVDARAVMDRLDEVVGPGNWADEYEHIEGGVLCKLSLKLGMEWITKVDGSPETAVEAFKGGLSKALVRAAVKWGIGRYLYDIETNFAETSLSYREGWKKHYDRSKNAAFWWRGPDLPKWALPRMDDYGGAILSRIKELSKDYQDEAMLKGLLSKLGVASSREITEAPARVQRRWYSILCPEDSDE